VSGVKDEPRPLPLDPAGIAPVVHRLRRAEGQRAAIVRMLEEGRGCEDVVTQLAAVSKALDRAGFALIANGMHQCLADASGSDAPGVQRLEKLFLSLA